MATVTNNIFENLLGMGGALYGRPQTATEAVLRQQEISLQQILVQQGQVMGNNQLLQSATGLSHFGLVKEMRKEFYLTLNL